MSINNVNLCGRFTKDVEILMTTSGKKVARFSLAVQRNKDEVDFINCQAWEKTAELLENYTRKGDRINIQGSIRVDNYTNNENRNVSITYVLVNQIELLEPKRDEVKAEPKAEPKRDAFEFNEEDLPF